MTTTDNDYKEVAFNKYCPKCKYEKIDDTKGKEPCDECLDNPVNYGTEVPAKFEEK